MVAHFASDRGAQVASHGFSGVEHSREGDPRFSYKHFMGVKALAAGEGLDLVAVENFTGADWSDVLLDGPDRDRQVDRLRRIVRDMGRAGIEMLGYNFSLAGVWGRELRPEARGRAMTAVFDRPDESPIPRGMVWNQVVDRALYERSTPDGAIDAVTQDQLWNRLGRFLDDLLPVAEEAGVVMALHPDDPPTATLRGTPRLVYRAELYDRVLAASPIANNALEFCVGSLAEMPDQDIYSVVAHFAATGRIAYVHLRNVSGRVPTYRETFVDDGDVDLQRVLRILADSGFQGVVVPDHAPYPTCEAPWHAGMAYAVGWIRASLRAIGELED
ncbi:MAG: mannonate dehydratase [Bifidobacteriaceae bacterium]|jgi:mannonate dehydratase|nr:mannonate dehydratase [Bifidobacteriaceae bacterium]